MLGETGVTRTPTPAQRRRQKRQQIAAELVAAGRLTGEKIARAVSTQQRESVGVDRRTIARWKGQAAFATAVDARREELRAAIQARFERDLAQRLDQLFAIE